MQEHDDTEEESVENAPLPATVSPSQQEHDDTTDESIDHLVALIESLATTPMPNSDLGIVHPETARTLSTKIINAWSGGRRAKIDKTLLACASLVSSLCAGLNIDPREPSKG